jgi:hypothetical protein
MKSSRQMRLRRKITYWGKSSGILVERKPLLKRVIALARNDLDIYERSWDLRICYVCSFVHMMFVYAWFLRRWCMICLWLLMHVMRNALWMYEMSVKMSFGGCQWFVGLSWMWMVECERLNADWFWVVVGQWKLSFECQWKLALGWIPMKIGF